MKFLSKSKDGGPESTVSAYWLVEMKSAFSIALLRFGDGSRSSYHSHAFNSVSWVLSGKLVEQFMDGKEQTFIRSVIPVMTWRETFHRVVSTGTSWVFTIRGPWADRWYEFDPVRKVMSTLLHGRKKIREEEM